MLYTNSELYNPKISVSGIIKSVEKHFEYDHAGRLIRTWHSVDGQDSVLLAQKEYNELGQLMNRRLHSKDTTHFRQIINHDYNIRSWLTLEPGMICSASTLTTAPCTQEIFQR
ncbi:MAG: hypothetical protein WDO14_00320 [Bacteroidota bacterium]